MIKTSKIGWLSVAMLLLMACGGGQKKEFNRLLLDVADKDEVIDATEWEQIVEFLDGQKAHFKDFYDDGQLDVDDVKEYINDFFDNRRSAFSSVSPRTKHQMVGTSSRSRSS